MPDHSERIAEIREVLRSGVQSTVTDGTTVTFDLASLRRELRELMAEDDTLHGRRPRVSSINLGNS